MSRLLSKIGCQVLCTVYAGCLFLPPCHVTPLFHKITHYYYLHAHTPLWFVPKKAQTGLGPAFACSLIPGVDQPYPRTYRPVIHHSHTTKCFPTHRRAKQRRRRRSRSRFPLGSLGSHRPPGYHVTENVCGLIDDHGQRASFLPARPGAAAH